MSLRVLLSASVAVTAALLAGCSTSGPHTARSHRAEVMFTCCSARDVQRTYHPGDVIALHWTRRLTRGAAAAAPVGSTLNARLDGGFSTVAQAKAPGASASHRVTSPPIRVTDRTRTAPTSRLHIPASAPPGWYDLTTRVASSQGNVMAGTTLVRVTARH